eukprot:COSAG05_NODE_4374_length_1545_cov_2.706086_1_plen_52_part_00
MSGDHKMGGDEVDKFLQSYRDAHASPVDRMKCAHTTNHTDKGSRFHARLPR